MRLILPILFAFFSFPAMAQQDTVMHQTDTSGKSTIKRHTPFELKSTIATVSVGFIDNYKQNYSLPEGYRKNNTSGFAPIYARLEYAVSRDISIAATFGYDAFVYNFDQLYTGNSGAFTRYQADHFRIFTAGLMGYYHFGRLLHVGNLDPFVGVGVGVSNMRHSGIPQGDTLVTQITHPVNGAIKVGARYYLSPQFSAYGDVGYDKQSVFSVGFSARFFKSNRKRIVRAVDSDGDGVPDKIDSCPHVKGLAAFNGCPDSDGDGIPDNRDRCPNEAGPADNNGCPVEAVPGQVNVATPPKEKVPIVIPKNIIQFAAGTDDLTDSSVAMLDSFAVVLKGSSKTDVSIEGYLSPQSTQAVSKKISNARIVAIKKYLVDKGIVATRMAFVSRYKADAPPKAKKKRLVIQLVYDVSN